MALGRLIGILGALALIAWVGNSGFADELIAEAIDKEERPQIVLSHPLPYKAIVCQSDYGQKPECRYYFGGNR